MTALAAEPDREAARRTLLDIVRLRGPDGDVEEPQRIALGRRRAAAAVALLRLGEREAIGELFTPTTDPEAPAQFLAAVRSLDLEPAALVECLNGARGDAARYWLILALGEFGGSEMRPHQTQLVAQLFDWYRRDPSSGIHGACGWLLRFWGFGREVDEFDATPQQEAGAASPARLQSEWFVERAGPFAQTMIVFAPGEYRMGSPPTELDRNNDESAHVVRLTRGFAMIDRMVTRDRYERFLAETCGDAAARNYIEAVAERSPTGWQPAVAFNWFDAVRFCRWLTSVAGMSESEQCYDDPANLGLGPGENPSDGQWPFHPERTGYRLPTEAEWEYACRAGTITAYSFGSDLDLAPRFGWFQGNSRGDEHLQHVLRPNPRGLRNMHGNNSDWCHDWLAFDPGAGRVDPIGPASGQCRVVRGGSYLSRPALARSASRGGLPPAFASPSAGLRLVRTLRN
jgi:formylglycine-generating enzyme required for sulfatase activity